MTKNNKLRILIFMMLVAEKPLHYSTIAKELDIPASFVHRELSNCEGQFYIQTEKGTYKIKNEEN